MKFSTPKPVLTPDEVRLAHLRFLIAIARALKGVQS